MSYFDKRFNSLLSNNSSLRNSSPRKRKRSEFENGDDEHSQTTNYDMSQQSDLNSQLEFMKEETPIGYFEPDFEQLDSSGKEMKLILETTMKVNFCYKCEKIDIKVLLIAIKCVQ
jgi:hypothetical protein